MSDYTAPDPSTPLPIFNTEQWGLGQEIALTQSAADSRYLKLTGGTEVGTVNFLQDVIVDTNTLYVDSATNNVGIGTFPSAKLDVNGTLLCQGTIETDSINDVAGPLSIQANAGDLDLNSANGNISLTAPSGLIIMNDNIQQDSTIATLVKKNDSNNIELNTVGAQTTEIKMRSQNTTINDYDTKITSLGGGVSDGLGGLSFYSNNESHFGTAGQTFLVRGNNFVVNPSTLLTSMYVDNQNQRVGINRTPTTYQLEVNGDIQLQDYNESIRISGTNVLTSDALNKARLCYVNAGRYLEVGADTSNASFIDFHSNDASTVDYDARILCQNGTGGTLGLGTMTITAGETIINRPTATAGAIFRVRFNGAERVLVSSTRFDLRDIETTISNTSFTDPDSGTLRAVKISGAGLAVSGGCRLDSLRINQNTSTQTLTVNGGCDLTSGNSYRIANTVVLSGTQLGVSATNKNSWEVVPTNVTSWKYMPLQSYQYCRMDWGTETVDGTGVRTASFNTTFGAGSTIRVFCQMINTSSVNQFTVQIDTLTTTGFNYIKLYNNGTVQQANTEDFYWFAIVTNTS